MIKRQATDEQVNNAGRSFVSIEIDLLSLVHLLIQRLCQQIQFSIGSHAVYNYCNTTINHVFVYGRFCLSRLRQKAYGGFDWSAENASLSY